MTIDSEVFNPTIKDSDFVKTGTEEIGAAPQGGEGENNTVLLGYEIRIRQGGKIVFSWFYGWRLTERDHNYIPDGEVAKQLILVATDAIREVDKYLTDKYDMTTSLRPPTISEAIIQVSELRHGLN